VIHQIIYCYWTGAFILAAGAIGCSEPAEGEAQSGIATTSTAYTSVAAGEFYTLALRSDGLVFAAGENSSGQLGNGGVISSLPTLVTGLTQVSAVAAGCRHSMSLTATGQVWTWGDNQRGQLGAETKQLTRTTPIQVPGLPPIQAIAAGCYHSMALDTSGYLWTWGSNSRGQLGTNSGSPSSLAPTKLTGFQVLRMDAGDYFSMALLPDGTVRAWGDNSGGQLATGSSSPIAVLSPAVTLLVGISDLAVGARHGIAFKSTAIGPRMMTWGDNSFCALGTGSGTPTFSGTPLMISGPVIPGSSMGAGRFFSTVAVNDDFGPRNPGDFVDAWGFDLHGELGNGNTTTRCQPASGGQYPAYPPVFLPRGNRGALSAGGYHVAAIDVDGKVVTWGRNNAGQLGNGSGVDSVWATATIFP
jgi:alpha-tubulin suppressor-like RCC1 family protein